MKIDAAVKSRQKGKFGLEQHRFQEILVWQRYRHIKYLRKCLAKYLSK
jgi:hypothetical protein